VFAAFPTPEIAVNAADQPVIVVNFDERAMGVAIPSQETTAVHFRCPVTLLPGPLHPLSGFLAHLKPALDHWKSPSLRFC